MFQQKDKQQNSGKKMDFEAKQNAVGFFDLLFKIAIRNKIDIGQFDNKNNKEKND